MKLFTIICLILFICNCSKKEVPPKLEGLDISAAKKELLSQGWRPRETYLRNYDGKLAKTDGASNPLYKAGYIELEYCSGTGRNYCMLHYFKNGTCLKITTEGMYEAGFPGPSVIDASNECPNPEILKK